MTAPAATIHVVGSMMIDRVVRVRAIPRPGETIAALASSTFAGGKGANQAAAAAKAGARVRMLGRTGRDGAFIREALENAGVRVREISIDDAVSGAATVMVAETGENAIVIAPESNLRIAKESVERFLGRAKQGEIVLLQNECSALHDSIAMAAARALRVWLNAAPADAGLSGLRFEKLAGLIVNETEAEALTGEGDPHRALEALAARMPGGTAIITLGAKGAIAAIGKARYQHRGFTVDAVDTVGCGDAFVGVFLAAVAEGRDVATALARGNAAGALAAMRAGAMRSLPSRGEIDTVSILSEDTRLKPRPPAEDEGSIPANCVGCGYALVGRVEGDPCTECGRVVRRSMFTGRWTSMVVRRRFARAWWIAAATGLCWMLGMASFTTAVSWTTLPRWQQDLFGYFGAALILAHAPLGMVAQVLLARGFSSLMNMRIGLALAGLRLIAFTVFVLFVARVIPWSLGIRELVSGSIFTMLAFVDAAFVLFLERSWRSARFSDRKPVLAAVGVGCAVGMAYIVWTIRIASSSAPTYQLLGIGMTLAGVWSVQTILTWEIARQIRALE